MIIAIVRSSRKWHTAFYIIGCMVAGVAVGATVGLALHNASAGGSLAALFMQVAGIVAAIERIRYYSKSKQIRV